MVRFYSADGTGQRGEDKRAALSPRPALVIIALSVLPARTFWPLDRHEQAPNHTSKNRMMLVCTRITRISGGDWNHAGVATLSLFSTETVLPALLVLAFAAAVGIGTGAPVCRISDCIFWTRVLSVVCDTWRDDRT